MNTYYIFIYKYNFFYIKYRIIATVRFYKSNHDIESNSIETVFMNIFRTILHQGDTIICTLINNIVEKKIDTISITKCILSIVRYEINIALTDIDKSRYDWYEVSVYDSLLRPQNTFLSSTRIVRKIIRLRKQNSITIKSYFPI